jgi:hypothetical protein
MSKARLASVLSVIVLVLAVAAAVLNYINNGRITWRVVAGLLVFVSLALVVRNVLARSGRTSTEANDKATK